MINSRSVQSLYAMLLCARVMYVLYTTSIPKYLPTYLSMYYEHFTSTWSKISYPNLGIYKSHTITTYLLWKNSVQKKIHHPLYYISSLWISLPLVFQHYILLKNICYYKALQCEKPRYIPMGFFYKDFFWLYTSYNYTMYTPKGADHLASIINNIKE